MSNSSDNAITTLDDAAIARQVSAARGSLKEFILAAWPIVEPHTEFVHGPHLDLIAEHLEAITRGEIRNLLINVPPRHMKSLAACVFWPVWEWIAIPQRRWLFASYAQSLSTRDSVRCRRLIESQWFQHHFGNCFALRGDQNTKDRFENDQAGCRIATSTGGAATGEGGDRIVVDDPHNVIDIQSDATRRAALEWWDQTMSTRLNDPKTGAKVIVMQRIHEKDLSGHVLEQGGYVHLCLPAEYEPARRCVTPIGGDWRNAEGDLLWPARVGSTEIAEMKLRLGPTAYAGQFQQRPAPAGGAIFEAGWFRYFVDGASGYRLIRGAGAEELIEKKSCRRFAVMDPAGTEPGEGNKPCYTVIQVWDLTANSDMLLVHHYRRQVQAPDAADAAIGICQDFDCEFIGIEKDGLGLGVVQTVRRSGVTVRAIKARGSKEARAQTAQIRMAAGQIYFPQGAPFLFDLENELLQFPRSEYADQVDALSHAAMLVSRMAHAPFISQINDSCLRNAESVQDEDS